MLSIKGFSEVFLASSGAHNPLVEGSSSARGRACAALSPLSPGILRGVSITCLKTPSPRFRLFRAPKILGIPFKEAYGLSCQSTLPTSRVITEYKTEKLGGSK